MTNAGIVKHLVKTNSETYNLLKTVEELTELSEVLMKKVLKTGTDKAPSLNSIVEEIGDVELRLSILKELLNCKEAVKIRVGYKLSKYQEYINNGKFIGKI